MRSMGLRAPHAASVLGTEFDHARAGAVDGPDDGIALLGDRLFVVSDREPGRWLYEDVGGRWVRHDGPGDCVTAIRGDNGGLTVASGRWPAQEAVSTAVYDGRDWSMALAVPATPRSVAQPDGPLLFRVVRRSPGLSTCEITNTRTGLAVLRWTAPLVGCPVWIGDELWLRYEAWPRQQLTAWSSASQRFSPPLTTPVGRLSGLVKGRDRVAAIWSDPRTPAAPLVAPTVADLVARLPANGGGMAEIAGIPVVVNSPCVEAVGRLVVVHGGPHSAVWPEYSPLRAWLARLGWEVVTPNVRSSALGSRFGGRPCRLGHDDASDLCRLIAELADGRPLVLVGWSYGAYLAARAVTLGARCDGLVAISGFLSPAVLAGSLHPAVVRFRERFVLPDTDPVLLRTARTLQIHGAHDLRIPVDLVRGVIPSGGAHTLRILPNEGHGIVTDEGARAAYQALADWLAAVSGPLSRSHDVRLG